MSAFQSPALDAVAFQLAAALDRYDQSVQRMVDTWLDMDMYRSVSDQVEEIRRYSACLPELSVPWVELLIAHSELVHSLWRLRFQADQGHRARLDEVRARHTACIESLKARCLRLLSRSELHGL
jgi:hypothetical protein